MKCAPIFEAYESLCAAPCEGSAEAEHAASKPYTIFLAPQGRRFDDACACELAKQDRLLFICGHYEGIDERAYTLADEVISLGDYVLTSGELASMVVIDAVVRKLPGVLGAETGALGESFADGLLEYPQYTRPASFNGMEVPAVLLSGNHGAVDRWRREQSLERTCRLRPDLLERHAAARRRPGISAIFIDHAAALAAARYHRQLSAYRAPLARALFERKRTPSWPQVSTPPGKRAGYCAPL